MAAQPLVRNQAIPNELQTMGGTYGSAAMAVAPTQVTMGCPQVVGQALAPMPAVQIHGKRRMLEVLVGFEQNNYYYIGHPTPEGQPPQEGSELFMAVEDSTCCERNCYPPDCGPWRMGIYQMPFVKGQSQPLIHMDRPCSFTCCCLNRPQVFISDPITRKQFGIIRDPFNCCDLDFQLKDPQGENIVVAHGGCCQLGLFCPCPGTEVNWSVNDPKTKQEVAHIKKIWKLGDCCACISKDMDWFVIDYGKGGTDPSLKTLVMILAMFIDFRLFNMRNQG